MFEMGEGQEFSILELCLLTLQAVEPSTRREMHFLVLNAR